MNKLLLSLALASLFILLAPGLASAQVTCGAILTSGTHILTGNMFCPDHGVTITGNNVVLDCRGFQIIGSGGLTHGIAITGNNNIVRNCNLVSGFNKGFYIKGQNNLVELSNANGNNMGFHISGSSAAMNTLLGVQAQSNANDGILIDGSSSSTLLGPHFPTGGIFTPSTISNNIRDGIRIDNSVMNGITANVMNNKVNGITITGSSTFNSVTASNINSNTNYGIRLDSQAHFTSLGFSPAGMNMVGQNGIGGILIYSNTNTLDGNIVSHNAQLQNGFGIRFDGSGNNTIINVSASYNGVSGSTTANGIEFVNSNGNLVVSWISSDHNNGHGIYMSSSHINFVIPTAGTVGYNANKGVYLVNSNSNLIRNLMIRNNGQEGVKISSSTGNSVQSCTIQNNGQDGINIDPSSATLYSNTVSGHFYPYWDIFVSDDSSTTGDSNGCNSAYGYNDAGSAGCDYTVTVDSDGDGINDISDDCPNYAGTSSFNGCTAAIDIDAVRYMKKGKKTPLEGLDVEVYFKQCALDNGLTPSWKDFDQVRALCAPVVTRTTDSNGDAFLGVEDGKAYIAIGVWNGATDKHLGSPTGIISAGEIVRKLFQLF